MKIGIDARASKWYRGTGIGTYTYQLINSLNKLDNINSYLLFMPENCVSKIKFNKNFHISNINEQGKSSFWDEVNIPNILYDKDIELYHIPQNGVGLPNEKNCKFVITLHDVIPYRMPETVSDKYLKIFSEEIPNIIPLCDGIITVSEFSKMDIIKSFGIPADKIYVTHLASEDIYKPMNKTMCKNYLNKFYSINSKFILYVGGFSPRKNIIGLIDAFSKVCRQLKDLNLIILGKHGLSYDLYKSHAAKLNISDKVLFPGFAPLEHMPIFYNASELFVYPSFYEGFGLPPIEAMACGVPVIASNITSLPEVLGDSALLINPNDIDCLAQSMYNVLTDNNLKCSLINKGLLRASSFSWVKTAKETLNSYSKII
ncbi:MAG: glycosyl transferase [Clostridiaceae bacterium]|jgi:glycosyltransferase involved in cell wall biosynthesis|nr:glycosyl transferase [Clostridiaceae bacterium]